jgi:hypothetical protein
MSDEDRRTEFAYDLKNRHVSSNIEQRYVIVPVAIGLVRALEPERMQDPQQVLDVGTSQGIGLNALINRTPFKPVTIVRRHLQSSPSERPDEAATAYVNDLVAANLGVGPSIGIDSVRPEDPGAAEWTWACSRRPWEFLGVDQAAERAELENKVKLPPGSFRRWDIARWSEPEGGGIEDGSMGVGFSSNVFYLIEKKLQATAFTNVTKKISQDGIYIWFEPSYLKNHRELPHIYRNPYATDYRFRAFLRDFADPSGKWHELLSFKGGRCMEAELGNWAMKRLVELDVPIEAGSVKRQAG